LNLQRDKSLFTRRAFTESEGEEENRVFFALRYAQVFKNGPTGHLAKR
jgi:hypothetical protein